MTRYFLTFGTLLATIGWLVLSYMPAVATRLPRFAFDGDFAAWLLPLLAGVSLVVFMALQVDLVGATVRMFRGRAGSDDGEALAHFHLTRGREVFWTVIPLASTLVLAAGLWAAR
jgi:heme/copper-type cytochrome/quinol oxidase subunit 2